MKQAPPNPILAPKVRTLNPDTLTAPTVFRTEQTLPTRELRRLFRRQSAAEFLGQIRPGFHVFGVSKGQFSLIDIVRAVPTRPARLISPSRRGRSPTPTSANSRPCSTPPASCRSASSSTFPSNADSPH